MEGKAGERMERLQAELSRVLAERVDWLGDIRGTREAEQAAVRHADGLRAELAGAAGEHATLHEAHEALLADNEALREQVAQLIGHHNPKQRIQHTMDLKLEIDTLRHDRAARFGPARLRRAGPRLAGSARDLD